MKNKKILIISLVMALFVSFVPDNVFAASATVYISPSSSTVTLGDNITVQVRVGSGADLMDSVQASLNFDITKLQFVSYSDGYFTKFQGAASGGAFNYAGMILGGSTSGDRSVFSVTLKTIALGNAFLSTSGVAVAYQGTGLTASSGTGSVNIIAPVVVVTPPPTKKTTTTPKTEVVVDSQAPKMTADPVVSLDKNMFTVNFSTDENAKIMATYTLGDVVKTIELNDFTIEHQLVFGNDKTLVPGTVYKVNIEAIDSLGNKGVIYSQDVRTVGVEFKVKIVDLDGLPLANHTVQLFSDPIETTTDANGLAVFSDVPFGNHTLVFEVDGLVLRQSVVVKQVGSVVVNSENSNNGTVNDFTTVNLPVKFLNPNQEKDTNLKLLIVAVAAGSMGAIVSYIMQIEKLRNAIARLFNRLKNRILIIKMSLSKKKN